MNLANVFLDSIPAEPVVLGESYQIQFKEASWQFDYLLFPKASDRLVILMPSAMAKGKRYVPSFHRHSWASIIDANVICVSDPTLYLSENLLGAWFQGSQNDFVLHHIINHLSEFQKLLGVERRRVLFAGSSLGAWAAIASATLLKGACAYAENPQTDLRAYLSGPLNNLNTLVFSGHYHKVCHDEPHRFSLFQLMLKESFIPPMYIVQKTSDVYHFENHFRPFVQSILNSSLERSFFLAEEIGGVVDSSGHTPLTSPEAIRRMEFILTLSEGLG